MTGCDDVRWDPKNVEHQELMKLHLWGNGAAKTPTIEEDLAMVRAAGDTYAPPHTATCHEHACVSVEDGGVSSV